MRERTGILHSPNRFCSEQEAGFSLIEILVALAISTFVVGAFQLMVIELVGTLEAAAENQRAVSHANSTLAALGVEYPLTERVTVGRYDDQMSYVLDVSPRKNQQVGATGQLYRAKLSIAWQGVDGAQRLEFLTHRIGNAL